MNKRRNLSNILKSLLAICLILTLGACANNEETDTQVTNESVPFNDNGGQPPIFDGSQGPQGMGPGMMNGQGTFTSADSPTDIITSDIVNTAKDIAVDESKAVTYVMTDENNEVEIDASGTYIITGTCEDGNITVKKNVTDVVLILKDLDLTSTTGATMSLNKYSEVKIVIEGNVTLTDNEDPALEDVSDDYDGAVIKAKDGSNVCLTGNGTLNINGNAKNGIKVGDEGEPSFLIDGDLTINIKAANDGINAGYDLNILSGTLNIEADDDAIHADRILTIGEDGEGPTINITSSKEGLEGSVVDLFGGKGTIKASDDGINAANSDGTYVKELTYSINITGGEWNIESNGDGLDSNGNINITGGHTTINSGAAGGEAGLDYIGSIYVADGTLDNHSGVAIDAGMGQMGVPGQEGGMNGEMPQGDNGQGPQGSGPQGGQGMKH